MCFWHSHKPLLPWKHGGRQADHQLDFSSFPSLHHQNTKTSSCLKFVKTKLHRAHETKTWSATIIFLDLPLIQNPSCFYSHTWGSDQHRHRRLNICKSTNIETAVTAAYWGWSLNFSPLPNNSWVKEPVGVFCSSAHHADNHFNLSLKRQKDGKWLCFSKQDKEQPKTCYLYSSILSVS